MEQFDKKIDGIRKMLEEMKDQKYAIVNPELVALDEYVKSLYMQVLCTVIQYENEPGEMQILYLKRIANGMDVEEPIEEYMKKALEISETDIKEFLSHMKTGKARYYFALDAILLVSMAQTSQPSYEYVAQLLELLEIDKRSLNHLALVAKSVLVQQSADFDCAKELATEYTSGLNFMPYIHNFYVGAIVDTPDEKYYASPDIVLGNEIELPTSFDERFVTFENLVITVSQDLHFNGCEKVRFKNCRLVGRPGSLEPVAVIAEEEVSPGMEKAVSAFEEIDEVEILDKKGQGSLVFNSVGTIQLENSSFTDFNNRVARIECINSFVAKNCKFVKCGYSVDETAYGGVFGINFDRGESIEKVVLENNELDNCYVRSEEGYYVGGVFVGCGNYTNVKEAKFINNRMIGCRCISACGRTKTAIYRLNTQNLVEKNNKVIGEHLEIFG